MNCHDRPMALRFDEFAALRRRQRGAQSRTDAGIDDGGAPVQSRETVGTKVQAESAGHFFESFEIQLLTLGFIFFDVVAAVLLTVLSCDSPEGGTRFIAVANVLESFMGFTIFYFLLELVVLAVAFRGAFFTHAGNLVDIIVVALCLAAEIRGSSRNVRILSLARTWRLVRLVNSLLNEKERELHRVKEARQRDLQWLEESKVEISRLEDSIRREAEAKKRVEKMLQGYKDEIETLNEALKIAALDIASAATEQMEEDEQGEAAGEESGKSKALGSASSFREVDDSKTGDLKGEKRAGRRVVIRPDGSYAFEGDP